MIHRHLSAYAWSLGSSSTQLTRTTARQTRSCSAVRDTAHPIRCRARVWRYKDHWDFVAARSRPRTNRIPRIGGRPIHMSAKSRHYRKHHHVRVAGLLMLRHNLNPVCSEHELTCSVAIAAKAACVRAGICGSHGTRLARLIGTAGRDARGRARMTLWPRQQVCWVYSTQLCSVRSPSYPAVVEQRGHWRPRCCRRSCTSSKYIEGETIEAAMYCTVLLHRRASATGF
nr:hypothetical protein CFP56_01293 [Quercus suber]